ncbi:MAG TPA: response regulator [Puia sp.]|jgi:CheY-like chemotaxis protein|nr:response regulator [Puia sp.]
MKRHILLVEDDDDDVSDFMAELNKINIPCKCTRANSGDQAISQLTYLLPDIIFLDVNLPGMNGLECLAEIRQIHRLDNVPVVLYSMGLLSSYKEKGMKLGASDCVEKPISSARLGDIIRKLTLEGRIFDEQGTEEINK